MRRRWKLAGLALLGAAAAGILAAVAMAVPSISITSLEARASGDTITSGPNGAGYDIRIEARVTDTSWRSTSWTIGGVTRCNDHENQSGDNNGDDRTVTLKYEYESNPALKAAESPPRDLPDPAKVGPSEHVFPPPVGGTSQLRIAVFSNDNCSGTPLGTRDLSLTTNVPATNKPLTAACQGLKVAVILDESGSIGNAAPQVRNATKALARGLVDTGARMAVFKFSTTADPSFIAPYKPITQAWIDGNNPGDLTYYLNRYDPGGTTNWDSGLAQARDQTASDKPDLVVFLTDGNPNRWAGGGTGVEEGYYSAVNPAANVANQLKLNSHMFAIGVGVGVTDALSALRIQAVSGIRSFPEYSIETADYTLITDFNKLEEALEDLASNLCNVTVTVRKETDEAVRDAWVSRAGWRFSGRAEAPPGQFNYQWYEPNRVTSVNPVNATQSGITAASGTLDFVWRPTSAAALSNITISETPLPATFEAESVKCTSAGTTILDSDVPALVESFTLSGLKVRDHVYCVVRNRFKRSTVRVVKQWVGDPGSTTIFVDATGAAPYDASTVATTNGASASFDYPVSTSVRVGETSVPAGYRATIQCEGQGPPQLYNGGPFPVTSPPADGATVTCTIVNIQNRSTVQVVKQWEGPPGSATIFVDQNGSSPFDASIVATASGQSTSFTYPTSTPVTVGEVAVPNGYSATIQCGQGLKQPYAGGPFPVTAPALPDVTLTCTITNKQKRSTVRVVKQWDGAPSSTTIFVDQDGAAPFQASAVATADGHSASFVYPVGTPTTVGETPIPAGYSATIDCGLGPQPYNGNPFLVNAPDIEDTTLTCTITNKQLFSTVRVVKHWVGAPAATTIFVDQTGASPFDAQVVNPAHGASASFVYPVSTGVTVGETVVPAGYSATIQCGAAASQPYTGGPFNVTSPAQGGGTLSCTITNTQLLSTVRVVKQWVGPPSSATIFVDQNGTAPFDASRVATANGDSISFDYPISTGAFVGETAVPTNYTATIQCGVAAPAPYTGGPFAVTAPATAGATLICTIKNSIIPATVRVEKQWEGAPASTTIFVDQDGVAPFDASTVATADGHNTSFDYLPGTAVFVGETAVPGGYAATIQCGAAAPQPYSGGPFAVTAPGPGATLTCTITNTQQLSTVRIIKQWDGAPASTTIFVDQNGVAPFDASTVATANGDSASFNYPLSTAAFVGETTVPTGYTATIQCGAATPQPYTGGPFAVTSPATHGATLTCTVRNSVIPPPATVRVIKQWDGAPASTTIFVDQDGVAPFDASTVAIADGDNTSFDYVAGTAVFVGETVVPGGYTATIQCGAAAAQPYAGGPFGVTAPAAGATLTCTITNTQLLSTVRVVKQWVGPPSSATIFVDQNGTAPFDASRVATANGDSISFDYPISTGAFVGETAVPTNYTATIQCGVAAPAPYTGGPFAVTAPATAGATLICTIKNSIIPATVRVEKQWEGAPASTTIFVDQDGVAPFDASTVATADGHNTSFDYLPGTAVFVGETAVPGGYAATIQCGAAAPQPYSGGPFAVTAPGPGATLTCTITNTQQLSTVRIIKQWDGAPASTTIFVDQDGAAPFQASTVATTTGDSTSFVYPVGTATTVGETPIPDGYAATIQCGDATPQPYTGGGFAVTSPAQHNATLTCTITNEQLFSTVRVVKQWEGAAASATLFVDQDGVAPFDASTVATADGESASFEYPVGTPVTVGEVDVPAGYSATIHCGPTREAPQPYAGGPFAVESPLAGGATLTCTITNTQLFSTVRVVKQWIGAPASATLFVDQNGTAPFDASTVATASGDSASFVYPVGTPVTVGEVDVPAGYSATIHCGLTLELPQPYSGGPFPVTSPTEGGATLTCTIINRQLRSTVQIVKEWAGAASSATLFVDANGMAPYDASTVATASGQGTSFTYPVSTPVAVGETAVPVGFRATIDCGAGPQAYAGGPFPVTSPAEQGATLTCTITNTPQTTVRVIKRWEGRPSSTEIFVDGQGRAPLDVSSFAEADGESASFDYAPSSQVTLGEVVVPPGYRAVMNCGTGPRDLRRYVGGPFTVTSPAAPGGVVTCTVFNVQAGALPGRLVIIKNVNKTQVRAPAQVRYTITARNRGPGIARNVRVCDQLPKGVAFVRAVPKARRSGKTLCWQIAQLRPRTQRSFQVYVRVVVPGRVVIVNTATISGTNTINCRPPATLSRQQRRQQNAACSDRARVVVLPARREAARPARARFTG